MALFLLGVGAALAGLTVSFVTLKWYLNRDARQQPPDERWSWTAADYDRATGAVSQPARPAPVTARATIARPA